MTSVKVQRPCDTNTGGFLRCIFLKHEHSLRSQIFWKTPVRVEIFQKLCSVAMFTGKTEFRLVLPECVCVCVCVSPLLSHGDTVLLTFNMFSLH